VDLPAGALGNAEMLESGYTPGYMGKGAQAVPAIPITLFIAIGLNGPRAASRWIPPPRKDPKLAAERGRGTGSAFQPRSQRPDQVAQDRRLAEDRRRDKPAHWGSGMTSIGAALTVVLALALLASPLAAEAQQAAKVARIGYLATAPAEAAS